MLPDGAPAAAAAPLGRPRRLPVTGPERWPPDSAPRRRPVADSRRRPPMHVRPDATSTRAARPTAARASAWSSTSATSGCGWWTRATRYAAPTSSRAASPTTSKPGTYAVYSRSRWAVGIDDSGRDAVLRRGSPAATTPRSGSTASRPRTAGLLQTRDAARARRSRHGCIRQAMPDAKRCGPSRRSARRSSSPPERARSAARRPRPGLPPRVRRRLRLRFLAGRSPDFSVRPPADGLAAAVALEPPWLLLRRPGSRPS